MKCIFLIGDYMQSCNASREVYVPSFFEQNEYCTSGRYKFCSFYCKAGPVENSGLTEGGSIRAG
jgi:hypothetical protein